MKPPADGWNRDERAVLDMTNGTPLRRIASSMYHLTRKTSTGESCVSPLDER